MIPPKCRSDSRKVMVENRIYIYILYTAVNSIVNHPRVITIPMGGINKLQMANSCSLDFIDVYCWVSLINILTSRSSPQGTFKATTVSDPKGCPGVDTGVTWKFSGYQRGKWSSNMSKTSLGRLHFHSKISLNVPNKSESQVGSWSLSQFQGWKKDRKKKWKIAETADWSFALRSQASFCLKQVQMPHGRLEDLLFFLQMFAGRFEVDPILYLSRGRPEAGGAPDLAIQFSSGLWYMNLYYIHLYIHL